MKWYILFLLSIIIIEMGCIDLNKTTTTTSLKTSNIDYIRIVQQKQDDIEADLQIPLTISDNKSMYWNGRWYINILSPPDSGPRCISCCDVGYIVLDNQGKIEKILLEYFDCDAVVRNCKKYVCESLPRFKLPWNIENDTK